MKEVTLTCHEVFILQEQSLRIIIPPNKLEHGATGLERILRSWTELRIGEDRRSGCVWKEARMQD